MAYEGLAAIYDDLMSDTDYDQWAGHINQLLETYETPGKQIVDLGCGTGNISLPLLELGWQVIGIDHSEEMLMQAEQKSREAGLFLPLIQQDLVDLALGFEVDGAIATFDTFNYILEPGALYQTFKRIAQALVLGGVLIFDINTPYKLRTYLGENTFSYHSDEVVYLWDNYFDEDEGICEMYLTFFVQEGQEGLYRKMEENHYQKCYEIEELTLWLREAGFELMALYDQLSLVPLAQVGEEHKVVFVARKVS